MKLNCTKCKGIKDSSEFHKWSSHKRGFKYHCRECRKGEGAEYKRKHYHDNMPVYNERAKSWKEENKERWNEYMREYRVSDSFSYKTPLNRFHRAKRRAAEIERTPAWSDLSKIRGIYNLCNELKDKHGVAFEVDHIYPLQGQNISGLHVWFNLMIIPQKLNRSKGNKFSENTICPRVSDNFDNYLSELKMYAELALNEA